MLADEQSERYRLVVGKSPAMTRAVELARKAASSRSTVLLLGESGSGKEIFARAIHSWGDRRHEPFIAINCVGLSRELLESELFGHEKGAFTGAVRLKKGKMELAHRGTVLLDEAVDHLMQDAYREVPRNWTPISRQSNARDFKTRFIPRLSEAPSLTKLPEGGQIPYEPFKEEGESYKISTYAKAVSMTRQMLVNDDLALADDQIPAFLAAEADWTDIDSNGSMILHGAFAGLEFRY